ncbi:MAG TPA: PEP/pyruvate-binding domain-containing protein [Myxococcota bacterium]
MATRLPLVILPRELGQVPPALQLIGHKARGLAQLLALKARVPRFGVLTAEAFDAHVAQDDVKTTIAAAYAHGFPDEASRLAHGEAMVRAILRNALPVAVRIGVHELLGAFAEEDLLAVRASVVGEPLEASVVSGALDSALGIKGKDALEDAILRMLALAFHPRTLGLREAAGLAPIGCRIAVVVQRMVSSESSGVCVTLSDASAREDVRRPTSLVRGCFGLGGGIGGKSGSARIPSDVVRVERPAVAADGIDDDARVEMEIAHKTDQLRVDDAGSAATGRVRMVPVPDHVRRECCVSAVQARMVAKEALRLEAAFGKPQVVSWAFAGRLLHILDVEPLLVPVSRVESERGRTWDDRLLPTGLLAPVAPLTFSAWQRAAARGVERAGRILGVKGIILEDTRPQMPRLLGHVSGRMYGNVEVLTALLDLLPFADKARAALAVATGQSELVPRKAPPPGFWQRQRQKLDDLQGKGGRWPGQLEKLSELATLESERYRGEVEATLDRMRSEPTAAGDPDALMDRFDELEDALSKVIASLVLSGLTAMLYRVELDAAVADSELAAIPGIAHDLVGGEVPGDLVELPRRIFALTDLIRRRPALRALVEGQGAQLDLLAHRLLGDASALSDDERRLSDEVRALQKSPSSACTGELALENPRLWERPDHILEAALRLLPTGVDPDTVDTLARAAAGTRKKAEYALELAAPRMKSSVKKRLTTALDGVRKHGRDAALLWIPAERVIDRLRVVASALGERLFEHGLLDQPRDIFHLQTPEIAGLVRGTSVDQDGKPVVAARKRQAAARPSGLPRRVETKGVVATSLLNDDDEDEVQVTAPGQSKEILGRPVSAGAVADVSVRLDGAAPAPLGVVLLRAPSLGSLSLLLASKAVVAERGTVWGPAAYALRALGIPTVVDAPQATAAFAEGETLAVDGATGVVKRATASDIGIVPTQRVAPGKSSARDDLFASPARSGTPFVDPHVFAREAVLSNPKNRPRASKPAQLWNDIPMPPRVLPPGARVHGEDEDFALMPGEQTHQKKKPPPLDDLETDDDDIVERTDLE